MTENVLWDLMLWAAMISQQPMPDALPEIQYVSNEFIQEYFCVSVDCHIDAFYVPHSYDSINGKTVYIKEAFSSVKNVYVASIIVHEFTHYLQHMKGAISPDITCSQWHDNERQAYRAQALFLNKC